ncbi:MAG: hypothetical protein JXA83_11630, partial [Acidimicrobiales bacterium]|nr:hypothetical protein [Acidimicrobiales bacterium]
MGTLRVAARRSPGRTGLALAVLVAGATIALAVVPDAGGGGGGGGPGGGATPPAGASSADGDEPTGDPPSRPGAP